MTVEFLERFSFRFATQKLKARSTIQIPPSDQFELHPLTADTRNDSFIYMHSGCTYSALH